MVWKKNSIIVSTVIVIKCLSFLQSFIVYGNGSSIICPKNIFYCDGFENRDCENICDLGKPEYNSRFIWINSSFKYSFKSKILSPLTSTLKVYTSWVYKSWPSNVLSKKSSNQIHLSIVKGRRQLINIRTHIDKDFQNIELCTRLYGVSYCKSNEIAPTNFEDQSEPKSMLLTLKFDVPRYIMYFCASADMLKEVCYYQVNLHEAKIFKGPLYFQIEIEKYSAINIDFDSIFHEEGHFLKHMPPKDEKSIFENVLAPLPNLDETFKMKETELCSSVAKESKCTIVPECIDFTCRRQKDPNEMGRSYVWRHLEKSTFLNLQDVNMVSIARITITLCNECKDGIISFLSLDGGSSTNLLEFSTVHHNRKLIHQFIAIFNGRRMVFHHIYASYKSVSVIVKFPFEKNTNDTCLETYKPILFLSKGNLLSRLGEIDIEATLWKGINITGFSEIRKIQTEKIFKRKFSQAISNCIGSKTAARLARRNVHFHDSLYLATEESSSSEMYIAIIGVSSTLTVVIVLLLAGMIRKYVNLKKRFDMSNESISITFNNSLSQTDDSIPSEANDQNEDDGERMESSSIPNVSRFHTVPKIVEPTSPSRLRSHAKIPVQRYSSSTLRTERKRSERRVSFNENVGIKTIPNNFQTM